jgi:hypothetical protein
LSHVLEVKVKVEDEVGTEMSHGISPPFMSPKTFLVIFEKSAGQ